jgi:acetoin utilization protein AcuB
MLVKDYMTRHPLMAEPTMPIVEAQRYMGENNVRHLPVVGDGKRLLGLVTRQRLLVEPGRLGSLDLVTIGPDATIEEAARHMIEKNIGCLPVLEDGVVIGIITETDLLAHLTNLLGWPFRGVRVTVRVPDRVGEFAKVTSAIASKGWGIYTAGSVPAPKHPGYWDGVFKVRGAPKDDLVAVLEEIEGQEIMDAREM